MLYKFEVQTLKDGTTAVAPTSTYNTDKDAEVAFHQSVAYNLQSDQLQSFLVMIITETGYASPNLTKFYNFGLEPNPDPEPEPEPDPTPEPEE